MEADESDVLEARAHAIPFFALAKHLLRRLPAGATIGELGKLGEETVRFIHDVAPIFHASDVAGLRFFQRSGREVAQITTTFLGLVGSVSPLANYFTEKVLGDELADNHGLRDFYDVFHHRLVSLLYRVHLRAAPIAEVRLDGEDRVSVRSLAASGMGGRATSALPRRQWLSAAPVLGRRPRTRAALEAALRLALPHLEFQVTDFLPRASALSRGQGPRMGRSEIVLRRKKHAALPPDQHADRVRLVVGPVGHTSFQSLMPSGGDHERLRAAVRATLGGRLDAELEIEIACGEEPRARMGRTTFGRSALVLRANESRNVSARLPITDDAEDARAVFLVSRPSA